MSMTADAWTKWFAELGRSRNPLTTEVLKSWSDWAKSRSETLQASGVDPRIKFLLSQLGQFGVGPMDDRDQGSESAEALMQLGARLALLEEEVARLKAETRIPSPSQQAHAEDSSKGQGPCAKDG